MPRILDIQAAVGKAIAEALSKCFADDEDARVTRKEVGTEGQSTEGCVSIAHVSIDVGAIVSFEIFAAPKELIERAKDDVRRDFDKNFEPFDD